jgi:hypothetical protein
MCNQRERLIGFIYNEGDAAELREVREHVEACAECRVEIGALRNVRDDLLAWDVPPSEPVWRPFTPAPPVAPVAWWRQAPAWTMVAAASVMLVAGFAGGAVAHGFGQESQGAPSTQVASAISPTTTPDLTAIEGRLRDFDARLVRIANSPAPQNDDYSALMAEIDSLRELNAKLVQLVNGFDAQWDKVWRTVDINNTAVHDKVRNLQQAVQQIVQGTSK